MATIPNYEPYSAKFYDISDELNEEYSKTGYITHKMNKDLDKRLTEYINIHNFKSGDILFVGSTYESRQEYGFYLVMDGKGYSCESIFDYILTSKILDKIKEYNIKYEKLFLEIKSKNKSQDYINQMFQDMFQDYDYIERFKEKHIYFEGTNTKEPMVPSSSLL